MIRTRFNGYEFSERFITLCDSRDLPEFQVPTTKIEGRDGVLMGTPSLGTREFTVTFIAKEKSSRRVQDAARELMRVLSVDEPKNFRFFDERDPDGHRLLRRAMPTGSISAKDFMHAGRWTVRFVQPDPYLYGKSRSVVLKKLVKTRVSAGGNAPAWWTATATPKSGSSYKLAQSAGDGWHVQFDAPFDGKHALSLNARKQTAKLSPAISGADGIRTGSRFEMLEGVMRFTASHNTTLSWTERWL